MALGCKEGVFVALHYTVRQFGFIVTEDWSWLEPDGIRVEKRDENRDSRLYLKSMETCFSERFAQPGVSRLGKHAYSVGDTLVYAPASQDDLYVFVSNTFRVEPLLGNLNLIGFDRLVTHELPAPKGHRGMTATVCPAADLSQVAVGVGNVVRIYTLA